jgi:hypothetical protein
MNIKKAIAREGLFILSFGVCGVIFDYGVVAILNFAEKAGWTWHTDIREALWTGVKFVAIAYAIRFIIRFVIWAIRTLRER